jgi:hypothetical protein
MKPSLRNILIPFVILVVMGGAYFLLPHTENKREIPDVAQALVSTNTVRNTSLSNAPSPQAVIVPSKAERARMSREARLVLLEHLGHVPDDADTDDFSISEKTSWWGKRLDPNIFWSNRVVWLDESALDKATRYGRRWPPIPFGDTSCNDRNDKDRLGSGFDIQGGPSFYTVSSDREHAFWDYYGKTHPTPPADLARWQLSRASSWMRYADIFANDKALAAELRMSPNELEEGLQSNQSEASALGYPPECVSSNAFYWAHVMQRRDEYAQLVAKGEDATPLDFEHFFRKIYVNKKFITEPLHSEQLQSANAWKVAYLRRLRAQKTDESYINAYLQAWGLDAKAVFKEP